MNSIDMWFRSVSIMFPLQTPHACKGGSVTRTFVYAMVALTVLTDEYAKTRHGNDLISDTEYSPPTVPCTQPIGIR